MEKILRTYIFDKGLVSSIYKKKTKKKTIHKKVTILKIEVWDYAEFSKIKYK